MCPQCALCQLPPARGVQGVSPLSLTPWGFPWDFVPAQGAGRLQCGGALVSLGKGWARGAAGGSIQFHSTWFWYWF